MNDIRTDFLIERYALISEDRNKRPHQIKKIKKKISRKKKGCFFCQGNESLTPPTIDMYPAGDKWTIRVFRNKFPALVPPKGDHEIIVDTAKHGYEIHDLTVEEIVSIFEMYEQRRAALEKKYKYVSIFKNVGLDAGASMEHSHTQILASPVVPTIVAEEEKASEAHYNKWHRCAWCDEIDSIKDNQTAKKTKHTIAITANAPRFGYEVWIMPKKHVGHFSDLNSEEKGDFCEVLKSILSKAYALKGAYNFVLHNAQKGCSKNYHFHVEILPRVSTQAGYELGDGAFIIGTSPETAAKYYRSK